MSKSHSTSEECNTPSNALPEFADLSRLRKDSYQLNETLDILPEITQWIEDYWSNPEKWSVFPETSPGATLALLPKEMPQAGESLSTIFNDFKSTVLPGLLHWNHPGFFGFFPCNTSGPSVASALITATLNVNPFSWNAGPSATELEMRVIEWLGTAIGLKWPGSLQDTASSATFCAVVAARERAYSTRKNGLSGAPRLRAYVSEEAHSSVVKALYLAGLGRDCVRKIPTHESLEMHAGELEKAILADIALGDLPFFVCSTLGSTSSTAFDDVEAISKVCATASRALQDRLESFQIWHHVDAALAGCAAILPEMQWMMRGVEDADSFLFNPHKWLFTHFECSALLVKNKREYISALSEDPAYLKDLLNETEKVEDFRNWSVQLGRGFRSLKLWFVLRSYGLNRIQNMLRQHISLTLVMHEKFQSHSLSNKHSHDDSSPKNSVHDLRTNKEEFEFITLNTPRLNTICFRLRSEAATQKFYRALMQRRKIYLTPTQIKGNFWLRIAIGQTAVQTEDIETLWKELVEIQTLLSL